MHSPSNRIEKLIDEQSSVTHVRQTGNIALTSRMRSRSAIVKLIPAGVVGHFSLSRLRFVSRSIAQCILHGLTRGVRMANSVLGAIAAWIRAQRYTLGHTRLSPQAIVMHGDAGQRRIRLYRSRSPSGILRRQRTAQPKVTHTY